MSFIGTSVVAVTDTKGRVSYAITVQSPLWAQGIDYFKSKGEVEANRQMHRVTQGVGRLFVGKSFERPDILWKELSSDTEGIAKEITGVDNLSATYPRNASVGIDAALWGLHVQEVGAKTLDDVIPEECRNYLSSHHTELIAIPLFSYAMKRRDVRKEVEENGCKLAKFKLRYAPEKGKKAITPRQSAGIDRQRAEMLCDVTDGISTKYTESGRIPIYFDANMGYTHEMVVALFETVKDCGRLGDVIILEEPFKAGHTENFRRYFREYGVRVAADESAHSAEHAMEQVRDRGALYVALKPIAKTISETFMTIAAISEYNQTVPEAEKVLCFCADLTVSPPLVPHSKAFSRRLAALHGMTTGAFETNGRQYLKNWEKLMTRLPLPDAEWVRPVDGVFKLGPEYDRNELRCMFEIHPSYLNKIGKTEG